MNYYIYVFLDPRYEGKYQFEDYSFDFKPFYVGKGLGSRVSRHLNLSQLNSNSNPHKERILKKIINEGFNPLDYVKIVSSNISEEEAFALEHRLIKTIGRYNLGTGPLCNLTDGGEGMSGHLSSLRGRTYEEIHGIEKAKKLREEKSIRFSGEKNPMYNKKSWCNGKNLSQETRDKISKSKSKRIYQIDKETNCIIREFSSTQEASVELGISKSGIHNCLSKNNRSKSSGGFLWKYIDEIA